MFMFPEIPVLQLNLVAEINFAGDLFLRLCFLFGKPDLKLNIGDAINFSVSLFLLLLLSLGFVQKTGLKTKPRRRNWFFANFISSPDFRFFVGKHVLKLNLFGAINYAGDIFLRLCLCFVWKTGSKTKPRRRR